MSKNLIGDRLRLARLTKKPIVRQKDLLARLDLMEIYMPESSISKIEAGTRSVTDIELAAIAKALRVDVNWLLGLK
jgi:transcriptional regulator with XRE-family HTH domain